MQTSRLRSSPAAARCSASSSTTTPRKKRRPCSRWRASCSVSRNARTWTCSTRNGSARRRRWRCWPRPRTRPVPAWCRTSSYSKRTHQAKENDRRAVPSGRSPSRSAIAGIALAALAALVLLVAALAAGSLATLAFATHAFLAAAGLLLAIAAVLAVVAFLAIAAALVTVLVGHRVLSSWKPAWGDVPAATTLSERWSNFREAETKYAHCATNRPCRWALPLFKVFAMASRRVNVRTPDARTHP